IGTAPAGTVCAMPPVTPDRISLPERYRVVRHLANGGMASVWEAHDELLDRDVAVKLLAPHLGEDERARKRFQREARAAAGLSSHPNVVTIYDVGEHRDRVFMVMEIMRGGSVADRLRSGAAIPHATAPRWLGEAATAASDRYALAVVAYELLTGTRPFEAEHFAAQARAHVEDPVPPASARERELSPAVDAVLERGLAKDPGDRWPSSVQFVGA